MKKILGDYAQIIGYTFCGLVMGVGFFLLFVNFYHYKEISTVLVKSQEFFDQTEEAKTKVAEVKTNISVFDPNAYNGKYDKYELMSMKSKLEICANSYDDKELNQILNKKEISANDVFHFQNVYQNKIVNECIAVQLYELGNTEIFKNSELHKIAPFIKINADNLLDDTNFVYNNLLNNSSYSFSSETAKTSTFEETKDSYYEINKSYIRSVEFLLEISRWYKNMVGGA